MDKGIESPFFDFGQQIINYLPSLLAGVLLLAAGWIVGWIVKRIVVQLLFVLRFEKLFTRLQWKQALSKADIRYALFGFIGNIAFFIVFLIFLNSALFAMKLAILSNLIEHGVLFIPRLLVALIIFGIGWIIAGRVANSVYIALIKEDVPNYSLISRFAKFVILLFFSAMALVEIDIAIEIVIIGFTTVIVSLSILAIAAVVFSSKGFKERFINSSKK
jgi:Mechanosensitive ion channel, conserved TM helix